jgi:iron complex outermembrane receptor protein
MMFGLTVAPTDPELDAIIITAERRAALGQEVAVASDVVEASTLEASALERVGDLAAVLPSLKFKSIFGSSAPQLFVRGVGNTDVNPSANPGVAVYIDDTLISSPLGQGLMLFDLERVELLKGPQGTLFGRNATGGALVLVTPRAGPDPDARIELNVGTNGLRAMQGVVNSGEIGTVRLRLAGVARASDGYTANASGPRLNEVDEHAFRLTAEVDFAEKWSARLLADVASDRSSMTAHVGRGLFDPQALAASPASGPPNLVPCSVERVLAATCANLLGYVYGADPYKQAYDQPGREYLDVGGLSLSIQRQGPIRVRAITAWREGERDVVQDTDASPLSLAELGFANSQTTLTQEVLFDGKVGAVDWRAGIFGLSETLDTVNRYNTLQTLRNAGVPFIPDPQLFFLGPFRLAQTYRQEIGSVAVFADADYALTDKVTLSGGVRLTRESTRMRTETRFTETASDAAISPLRSGRVEDDQSAWRLAARYTAMPEWTLFGTVSQGFKSANFNGGALFPFDELGPVAPERLTAFEVGVKAQPTSRLRAEASVYRYAYDGLQTFTFRPAPPPTRQVLDSGDAEVTGVDVAIKALLPLNLEAQVSGTWLDAKFTNFVDANGVNRSGNPMPNAPEVAISAGLSGTAPLGTALEINYGIRADHRSQVSFDTTNSPLLRSGARTLVDARIGLTWPRSGVALTLDATNLSDEAELIDALNIAEYGLVQQTYGTPRTVTLRLAKRF